MADEGIGKRLTEKAVSLLGRNGPRVFFWVVSGLLLAPCVWALGQGRETQELGRIAAIYKGGDSERAVGELRGFVAKYPRNCLAWTILGNALADLDRDEEAVAAFREAIRVDPKKPNAYTGLGILARRQGRYQEARGFYESALALDPSYAQAHTSLAVIFLKLHQDADALVSAKKAYALEPTDPAIVANLAVAYHYNGLTELRDRYTEEARRLGYGKIAALLDMYSGETTIRD